MRRCRAAVLYQLPDGKTRRGERTGDGGIVQQRIHEIPQHGAKRREQERRDPEIGLSGALGGTELLAGGLGVALERFGHVVRVRDAEARLLEGGAFLRGVAPRGGKLVLHVLQVRLLLPHLGERLAPLAGSGLVHALRQAGDLGLVLLQLPLQQRLLLPALGDGFELLLNGRDLLVDGGDLAARDVLPLALPGAELSLRLGEGGGLLPRRDHGRDAALELGRTRDGDAALPDEGRAREDRRAHAGERLADGRGVDAGDGFVRAGIDGGEIAHGRLFVRRRAAERDAFALVLERDLALHGRAAPRGIPRFGGQLAAAGALGRVHAVEHGAQEGAPRALAALVRRVDDVEAAVELELVSGEGAEGGLHGSDDHKGNTSSSRSSAARPQRAACVIFRRSDAVAAAS